MVPFYLRGEGKAHVSVRCRQVAHTNVQYQTLSKAKQNVINSDLGCLLAMLVQLLLQAPLLSFPTLPLLHILILFAVLLHSCPTQLE